MSKNRSEGGRFAPGLAHPKAIDRVARLAHLREMQLGTLEITGDQIILGERSRQYIETHCRACGTTRNILVENIIRGLTTNCRCQRGRKYDDPSAPVLGERYDAIVQRCGNAGSASYRNYGEIRIECRFKNREEFIRYILKELPEADYRGLDIDRIDNAGHYEPGNLRIVTRSENLRNKSTNKFVWYNGKRVVAADLWKLLKADYPSFSLSKWTTAKLAASGVPWEEILLRKPRPRRM